MNKSSAALACFSLMAMLFGLCQGGPTACEHWGSDIRCSKENADLDQVRVDSITGNNVTFRVGFWISTCGLSGTNYNDIGLVSGQENSAVFEMEDTAAGKCREAFIYDCQLLGLNPVSCIDYLHASRVQ